MNWLVLLGGAVAVAGALTSSPLFFVGGLILVGVAAFNSKGGRNA